MVAPEMLAAISKYFVWWQLPLLVVVVALIVFLIWRRRSQM